MKAHKKVKTILFKTHKSLDITEIPVQLWFLNAKAESQLLDLLLFNFLLQKLTTLRTQIRYNEI